MIEQAIKLKDFFDHNCHKMSKSLHKSDWDTIPDELQTKNWELIMEIKKIITIFFQIIKNLEGNANTRTYFAL